MNTPHPAAKAAAAAAFALLSSTAFALDLMDTYAKALQNDPRMLAADAALLAGREKAVQGSALRKPQVSLSASLTHMNDRSSTSLPPQLSGLVAPQNSGNMRQVGVHLVQPIYSAKARVDSQQLQQRSEMAELSHRDARQDLMQRAGEAYFNVLLAQENLRVVEAEKHAVGMQRDRAQVRFDVGRGKITDLQEAQARYDSMLTREVSAQSNLALRQAQYAELTGVPAEGLAGIRTGFVPTPPMPDSLQAWQQRGQDNSLRVLTKQSELTIASVEIDKHKLSGRPSLDLVASLTGKGQSGSASTTLSPDSNRNASIGLQFSVPLYAGGALDSREREAVAKKTQAEQELGAAKRDARLQVQDQFLAVKTGVARIAALTQSLTSAQTALAATTLGRDVGTRTELDVLDAQQRVYAAQLDLAQARNDYLLGRIRLAAAAGELQEGDLRALNADLASSTLLERSD
jgi:outer membrane protein